MEFTFYVLIYNFLFKDCRRSPIIIIHLTKINLQLKKTIYKKVMIQAMDEIQEPGISKYSLLLSQHVRSLRIT